MYTIIAANTDAPGGSCLCIASYTLTQDNIEYGSIAFNVDANAKAGSSDTNVTTSGSLNLNLLQRPIIYASKSVKSYPSHNKPISSIVVASPKILTFCPYAAFTYGGAALVTNVQFGG